MEKCFSFQMQIITLFVRICIAIMNIRRENFYGLYGSAGKTHFKYFFYCMSFDLFGEIGLWTIVQFMICDIV